MIICDEEKETDGETFPAPYNYLGDGMKVFEVTTEHCAGDSKEILTTVQYVTSEEGTLQSVTDHFTDHCEQYEKDLKGVREVLVIVQHITS